MSIRLQSGKLVTWLIPSESVIHLYNIHGQRIASPSSSDLLDLSAYSKGTYRLVARKGNQLASMSITN
ncbi:MAG: hypothetical protein JXR53_10440 [Bacteroidales bacterium]|nr:hypothetical protein [Bacteroidales bacterium]